MEPDGRLPETLRLGSARGRAVESGSLATHSDVSFAPPRIVAGTGAILTRICAVEAAPPASPHSWDRFDVASGGEDCPDRPTTAGGANFTYSR
jgi:hypothetical protein